MMSGGIVSPGLVPPACRFFREVTADPGMTDHDFELVAKHTKECMDCENVIGQMFHEKIESNKQADASGA